MSKPTILLIYTGGTIGMAKDPKTGNLRAFNFDNLLTKIPELNLLDCQITTVSIQAPIDSSNMTPNHWVEIAELIEHHYERCDGFVVLHGSDTMSYTASALSFMLENLTKPIIFTGSQLPIGDLRTDAKENLITSIQIAALQQKDTAVVQEVAIYFEYKLYRANRTTKINAEHFEAFTSLNYPALITSGVHLNINYEALFKPKLTQKLNIHKTLNTNVTIVKLFPGISKPIITALFSLPHLEGIILETFGAGNAITNKWFIELLQATLQRGVHIVNVTQCLQGHVIMGQYETSTQLKKIGLISGHNITTEAAVTKLMYLLSKTNTPNEFRIAYETSLRGELS